MTRIKIDGGSYCFVLPDGGFGVLMPSSVNTSSGSIPLPGEPVLFLVGQRFNGRLLMAGQGHDSGSAWFFDGVGWSVIGTTYGVSPCAFGLDALYVATSDRTYIRMDLKTLTVQTIAVGQIGSQGFRYIDGQTPITGDMTFRDGELFEWTRRDAIRVGQGHEGNAIIQDRILDPGDRRFIRFERDGEKLAIGMVDQPDHCAILIWLSVAEIQGLPLRAQPAPDKPPVPVPVPVPPPTPEPTMPVQNKAAALEAFHQSWNGGQLILEDPAKHAFTAAFAASLGGRFGRKSRPGNSPLSKDTLAYWLGDTVPGSPTDGPVDAFDLIGSDGRVSWDTRAENGDPAYHAVESRWYPAVAVTPAPAPPPSGPSPELAQCTANLAASRARITDLEAQVEAMAHAAAHPEYDEMMMMLAAADAAYQGAQHARHKTPMGASLCGHLTWRLLLEGYKADTLIEDARERGAFV